MVHKPQLLHEITYATKKLPVMIMIGTGDNFHYLVAFGAGKSGSTNWVYVTDNSSYISAYGYKPLTGGKKVAITVSDIKS